MMQIHVSVKPDRSNRITLYHYYILDKKLPLFIFFDDGIKTVPIVFKINGQDFRIERYAPYDLIEGGTDDEAQPFVFPDKGDYTIEAFRGEQLVGKAIFHIGKEPPPEPPADLAELGIEEEETHLPEPPPTNTPAKKPQKTRIDLRYDLSQVDVFINDKQFKP